MTGVRRAAGVLVPAGLEASMGVLTTTIGRNFDGARGHDFFFRGDGDRFGRLGLGHGFRGLLALGRDLDLVLLGGDLDLALRVVLNPGDGVRRSPVGLVRGGGDRPARPAG